MKVQHGDILVFHSHSWISVAIQFFMNMWRWVSFKFKPFYAEVPNHVALGDNDNCIIEARMEGVFITPFDDILKTKMRGTIKVYRYEWSIYQEHVINQLYKNHEGKSYQFINFLQYIPYILTFGFLWIGSKRKSSEKKLYCSELAANVIYNVTASGLAKSAKDRDAHLYFRDYWKISPYVLDRWCAKNCELVEIYSIKDGIATPKKSLI